MVAPVAISALRTDINLMILQLLTPKYKLSRATGSGVITFF